MVAAGEVSANITLKVVGCNLVVNRSVALVITALLLAEITEAGEAEATMVNGWGLTSLSFLATHKSLEVSAFSCFRLTVIQAT